jgi:hypothetical protein
MRIEKAELSNKKRHSVHVPDIDKWLCDCCIDKGQATDKKGNMKEEVVKTVHS